MKKRQIIADYLTFSRKDRIGLLVLISLILIMIFLPRWFGNRGRFSQLEVDSTLLLALDSVHQNQEKAAAAVPAPHNPAAVYQPSKTALFSFDPNTLPEAGWLRLGLTARTAKTIRHYLDKGGHFYRPEDLKKIWGLPEGFYDKVARYVQIAPGNTSTEQARANRPASDQRHMEAPVDINTADTTAFIALPGIGSKLASRIVNFRAKLGGFSSVNQIGEVYGLPDSTFRMLRSHLKLGSPAIKTININTASKDELKSHPYIRWNLANAIVEYRNQHGPFQQLDDLKNIHLITDDVYRKLTPYLSLQ